MTRPSKKLLVAVGLAVLGLVASSTLPALSSDRALNEFSLSHWNSSNGLAHNMVTAITQTHEGHLWLGSFEGMSRFNGLEFVTPDGESLPFADINGIRGLVIDADGRLWVSSARAGLYALDQSGWHAFGPEQGQPFNQMLGVEISSGGWLWLIGEESGLARWQPGKPALRVDESSGLSDNTVYMTIADGTGGVYVGSAGGLDQVSATGVVTHIGAQWGLPTGAVRSLQRSVDGELVVTVAGRVGWIGPKGYRPIKGKRVPTSAQTLLYDSDGGLLIGTGDQGLWRYGPRGLDQLDRRHGLRGNRVVSLFEDREGSIWIGSSDGLYQLRDLRFSTIDRRHGIGEGYVRALWESPPGTLWIGSTDGLYRRTSDSVQHFDRNSGLPIDSILSLVDSKQLGLLVGTFGGGLVRIVAGHAEPVPGTQALSTLQIRALLPHSDGSLWIASNNGLFHLQMGELTRYGREQGLQRDFTMALSEDQDGAVWVGTSGGLDRVSGTQVQSFGRDQGLDAEDIFCIYPQPSGDIWLASNRGLKRYAQGKFENVVGDDAAFNTSLFQILEDAHGNFWISSNRGIFRVAAAELAAVRAGRPGLVHVQRNDRSDGMSNEQANGASQSAGIRLADGQLRFATAEGVVVIAPDRRFPQRPVRIDPVIESVAVDGLSTTLAADQILPAGTRRLEFRYVGLSLLTPERVRYRHRLLGFDEHWIEAGVQRQATYTNLAPGKYRFEIETRSFESQPKMLGLDVSIAPLWWQRRSIQLLIGLLGLLLLMAAWRRYNMRLLHRSRELERLVAERTHDLESKARELAQVDQDRSLLVERLRDQAEAFEHQAREDWLTSLPNRRAFEELLQQQYAAAKANSEPLCVALADIDHFKSINDQYSHATGDLVLIEVARLLRQEVAADTAIARWGGEEFMLLLPHCTHAQATERCERIRMDIANRQPFLADGMPQQLTLSIGVAELDATHTRPEQLLSMADRQLYQAKNAGRNCVR